MSHKILISNGEILDKISILTLKTKHISDQNKLHNVYRELSELQDLMIQIIESNPNIISLYNNLVSINSSLWDIENNLRLKEKQQTFDREFIELARSVYKNNDQRAKIKKDINLLSQSYLIEEKSYEQY